MNAIHFHEGPDLPGIPVSERLAHPRDLAPAGDRPDARIFLLDPAGIAIAHAALWWRETPPLEGEITGTIGGFDATDEMSAISLLHAAIARLRTMAVGQIIGPMNGNTWRRHRFVTGGTDRKPFLLEPRNPPDHPAWWRAAGFEPLSRYSSSAMPLDGADAVAPGLRRRLGKSGVTIRPLDPSRYVEELRGIHAVSLRSFARNFLYTPLDEESFVGAYLRLRDQVDPDLVRIAEKDGAACGFVFAVADLEAASRGERPALIVKTLAVDPTSRSAGLGSLLVDEVHRVGKTKGFSEAIHALQHETNTSLKITGRHRGERFREYTLFVKSPGPTPPETDPAT